MISLVVCTDLEGRIKSNGGLLVDIPSERRYFRNLTRDKVCIMDEDTFKFIMELRGKPLDNGRLSVILSNQDISGIYESDDGTEVIITDDVDKLVSLSMSVDDEEVMVIGGEQVYHQFIDYADYIYMTTVMEDIVEEDAFFQLEYLDDFKVEHSESFIDQETAYGYNITKYVRK